MAAITLDGERVATELKVDLGRRVEALADRGITPGLGTILVGDDGPSAKYVGMKHHDCAELGMASVDRRLPATATQAEVEAVIDELNADPAVDAFIVQYPFPAGLDYSRALLRVDPAKDADGLHPVNLGLLVMGEDAPVACTPRGILHMLHAYDVPVAGRHVVIVGRGLTIGRPLANLLTLKHPDTNAAVTVVHTGVDDLGAYTRTADIVVAAAGSPGLDHRRHGPPRGGGGRGGGELPSTARSVSDVADEVAEVAGWLSPRIGGVGAMTRAFLLVNTVEAGGARRRTGAAGTASSTVTEHHRSAAPAQRAGAERRVLPAQDRGGRGSSCDAPSTRSTPLDLAFVSVTYGAGGSTRDRTRDLVIDAATNSTPARRWRT